MCNGEVIDYKQVMALVSLSVARMLLEPEGALGNITRETPFIETRLSSIEIFLWILKIKDLSKT